MANTTFNGPVRSENGFEQITKNGTTGAVTTTLDIDTSGNITTTGYVAEQKRVIRQTTADGWNDGAVTLTTAQKGSIILLDKDEATVVTLPAITSSDIGVYYTFIETVASDNARSIVTAYDNDYWVGGLVVGTTPAESGSKSFVPAGGTDTTITFDDNLANGMGALGSTVTLTSVLTGNTGAGGGAKLVWAVSGHVGTSDANGDGTAIFT